MEKPSFSVQCMAKSGEFADQPHPITTGVYRLLEWLCFFTTCLAFMLGVGVGVALPITYHHRPSSYPYTENDTLSTSFSSWSSVKNTSRFLHLPVRTNLTNTRTVTFIIKGHSFERKKRLTKNQKLRDPNRENFPKSSLKEERRENVPEKAQQKFFGTTDENETASISGEAVNGVFWSQAVENLVPVGFLDEDNQEWNSFSHQSLIIRMEEGCGRMQNRLIIFENGRKSCVRYRQNNDQIQGEIFSFYLSRLLGIGNVPPSSLGLLRHRDRQWANVQSSLAQAQWIEDRPVVYTQFLNYLEPAYIPEQFRWDRRLNPSDVEHLQLEKTVDRSNLITLAQWSDLLIFDYLTANLDRMVNNLYNVQWNPAMMDSPVHNLVRDSRTGLLVFLDNESGLLHGYRLLDKYEVYHKNLLDSLCIFRRTTIESLRLLQAKNDVDNLLRQKFEDTSNKQILDVLPFLPEKSIKTLKYRIHRVLDQVTKCESLQSS